MKTNSALVISLKRRKVRRSSSAPHELTISAHAVDSGATDVAVDAGEALESTEAVSAEDKNRK